MSVEPTAIDVEAYRAEFPVLERKAYLISASLGPVSTRARRYLDEYVDIWATEGAPDPVWMEHIFPQMGRVKDTFAALIGATREELAITVNVSLALSADANPHLGVTEARRGGVDPCAGVTAGLSGVTEV